MLDGDYELIVERFKDLFLRQCTQALSLNGARDVKCVGTREGSIIVDIRGSTQAVDAAVADITANGLDLPDFEMLRVQGMLQALF